jgi:hypothetical protein
MKTMEKHIIHFFKRQGWRVLGIFLGAIGGYLYYLKVGCASGTCPITSNPYISVAYGGLLGLLTVNIFKS